MVTVIYIIVASRDFELRISDLKRRKSTLNVIIRIVLSVMLCMIIIAIVDYYIQGGFLKYLLIGLVVAGMSIFNQMQNLKLRRK